MKRVPIKAWIVIAALALGAAVPSSRTFLLDVLKAALTADLGSSDAPAASGDPPEPADGGTP